MLFTPSHTVANHCSRACLFALFTFALTTTHTYYILHGQTTVESMQISMMKQREHDQLASAFKWWECSAKTHTVKDWDREWGHLTTEGNIWWLGSSKREWEAVMGKNPLGWIRKSPRISQLCQSLTNPLKSLLERANSTALITLSIRDSTKTGGGGGGSTGQRNSDDSAKAL